MAWAEGLEWPPPLRPLVAEYGPAAVWVAGLAALGYPPTWCDRWREFEAVRVRLLTTTGD